MSNHAKSYHAYPDCVEWSCLQPARCADGVPMHGIADPGDNQPGLTHSSDHMGELGTHVLSPHSCDKCQPPGLVVGIQNLTQFHKLWWIKLITNLYNPEKIIIFIDWIIFLYKTVIRSWLVSFSNYKTNGLHSSSKHDIFMLSTIYDKYWLLIADKPGGHKTERSIYDY